ncbi:hypothetical protein CLOSTASPAR_01649 [[Clostridium] asparagiforme DSM 15981]|uniref:Uncharacterized protein n=1 Tax=[Clostridium] asparagiforme DSM 15981 TaxID=518636 RepID=C0CXC8_9FIRM|nr:hypothetical protein CLOSTASPAR_01649 [[Clostridium] asparagiforme DSM 15981]
MEKNGIATKKPCLTIGMTPLSTMGRYQVSLLPGLHMIEK